MSSSLQARRASHARQRICQAFTLGAVAMTSACATRAYNQTDSQTESVVIGQARGTRRTAFTSPKGLQEVCIVPKHFPGGDYSKGDARKEDELCAHNFHKQPGSSDPGNAVAVCPKINSTFPGLDIHELGSASKSNYESTTCRNEDKPTSKLAKYKQSVSCSYTGSILGYYHLSRILDAGDVPPGVIRTMDVTAHKAYAERGVSFSTPGEINHTLWKEQVARDSNPTASKENYFTSDGKQLYGALVHNPRDEERYAGINFGTKSRFMQTPEFQRVVNPGALGTFVKRDFASAAPVIQQMKDLSDLVLMDFLMAQQDRFGNIHGRAFYAHLDEKGEVDFVEVEDVQKGKVPKPANAVAVTKLMLKDNDCGNRPGNDREITLTDLGNLRHMSVKTYKRLRWIAAQWKSDPKVKTFFRDEALLGEPDLFDLRGLSTLENRLAQASATLTANCKSGKLLLDLSIEDHINSKNMPDMVKARCDEIYQPKPDEGATGGGNGGGGNGGGTNPIDPVPPPVASFPKGCKVTTSGSPANVRKSPSTNGQIYMTLNNGASVKAVAEQGSWLSLEYRLGGQDHGEAFGRPAWMSKTLLNCQ